MSVSERPTLFERVSNPSVISVALFLITLGVFWESQYYGYFAVDDNAYVTTNPLTRGGVTADNVVTAFTEFQISNYHPLTMISLMMDTSLFGSSANVHHLTNILLHAANALLLFWVLWTMTRALWPSAAVALLFAVHPVHVEPVVWISSRKDVLSTFFMLGAIGLYIRYVRTRSPLMYALVAVAFACALLSKQMPVTLPFALLLLDFWPLNRFSLDRAGLREFGRLFVEKIPLLVVSLIFAIIVVQAQGSRGALLSIETVPLVDRIKNTPLAYVMYIAQTIVPIRLQAIGYRIPFGLPVWQSLASVVLLAAITAACIRYIRTAPYLAVGWFFFLGTFVPVIGFITLGSTYRADRYAYVPLIGLFIAVAWGVAALMNNPRFEARRPIALVAAGVLLFVYTVSGWLYVGKWRDNETILGHVLELDSGHHLAQVALGDHYLERGNLMKATEVYLETTRNSPPAYSYASSRLGRIQYDLGHYDRALLFFSKAYEFDPGESKAITGLAQTLATLGRLDEAEKVLVDAIESGHPDSKLLQAVLEHLRAGNY